MVFSLMKEGRGVWSRGDGALASCKIAKAGDAMNGSRKSRLSSDWVAVPGACVMCMNLFRSESSMFAKAGRSRHPTM